MKLYIAEKPSLARAIAVGIGDGKNFEGYISLNGGKEIVTWCFGHILENFSPDEYAEKYKKWRMEDLPIVPNIWRLKVKTDTAKQFKIIRDLTAKATMIVNADDPDREGQLLVDEILDFVGNKKPVQRISRVKKCGEIPATWQMTGKVPNLDSEGRLLDLKIAEKFLEKFKSTSATQGKIISVEEKNKSELQRLPYSLSTLQKFSDI